MTANSCEMHVGRLMEIRVAAGYRCVSDVDQMIAMMRAWMGRVPPEQKLIIAADWRGASIMSPETAERARDMLAMSNPRVIRSAILTAPDQSTTNLQVFRLVREAENSARRHFTVAREQCDWLAEVLTTEETARLRQFLPG